MMESCKIIDNLLIMIVTQRIGADLALKHRLCHLDLVQDELLREFPTWIKPALEYLKEKKEEGKERTICMANDDWINRSGL